MSLDNIRFYLICARTSVAASKAYILMGLLAALDAVLRLRIPGTNSVRALWLSLQFINIYIYVYFV